MGSSVTAQLRAIGPKHVLLAVDEVTRDGFPPEHASKKYNLFYKGKNYPQKYIASLATRFASGTQLLPHEFSASQSLPIFELLGFTIRDIGTVKSGNSSKRKSIDGEIVGDLYYYSKEVYEQRIKTKDALQSLGMNEASARDCFRVFRQMRRADVYQRTMNAETTEYFLTHIYNDYGIEGLDLALQSLEKHLRYYDALGSGTQRRIRNLWEKYSAIKNGGNKFHDIRGSYTGVSPSFRKGITKTPIDLARANKLPSAPLSERDRVFLEDIWGRYGMTPFERRNLDAGNVHRALDRGFVEHVSGDGTEPECTFQLTEKANLLFESEDALFQNEVGVQTHVEGEANTVMRTIFKRNPNARGDCLKHHGYCCKSCGFNFERVYGVFGRKYIHVHHLVEISSIGNEYTIDPINDLVPVCANCHAMLHRKRPAFTIEELKKLMAEVKKVGNRTAL